MKSFVRAAGSAWIAAFLILLHFAGSAQAGTLIGRNVDSRFMLAFSADAEEIGELMPEGWSAIAFPSGPLKGANLLIGLEDRHLALTPDGDPASPPKSRAAAVMALGKGEDGVRLFVLRVFTSDRGYSLFPDGVAAEVTRRSVLQGAADGGARQSENWSIRPETGGSLAVSFDFAVGVGAWKRDEARPYSSADPGISRVFRYDQLVELVMSASAGKALDGSFSLAADVPSIGGLFDGTEKLVGLMHIPVYVREVFEP